MEIDKNVNDKFKLIVSFVRAQTWRQTKHICTYRSRFVVNRLMYVELHQGPDRFTHSCNNIT